MVLFLCENIKVAPVQQEGESMAEKLITVEVEKSYRDLEKMMS